MNSAGTARLLDPADLTDALATEEQKLLNIAIRYTLIPPTREEDYEELKEAVSEIDIIGILGRGRWAKQQSIPLLQSRLYRR